MPLRGPVKTRPSGPGGYFFRCSLKSATSSGWRGTGRGLTARTVLELAALASRAAVGPPGAAARLGVGQDQFAPAVVGQAGEVLGAQLDSFFGAQRRVVHTAEKGDHPLPA